MASQATVIEALAQHRIVPVVSEGDVDQAMRLADALVAGGLPVMEVTLRVAGALEVMRAIAARGDILTLAGTVLTAEQVEQSADAGAEMIVSPGYSQAVVEKAAAVGVPVCPGVCTPTDIQAALSAGIDVLKFFPAGAMGGVGMLKSLAAPYPMVRFMPTGGVSLDNLSDYLGLDAVIACGGSWMVARKLYADGDFEPVERVVREAVQLAASV